MEVWILTFYLTGNLMGGEYSSKARCDKAAIMQRGHWARTNPQVDKISYTCRATRQAPPAGRKTTGSIVSPEDEFPAPRHSWGIDE